MQLTVYRKRPAVRRVGRRGPEWATELVGAVPVGSGGARARARPVRGRDPGVAPGGLVAVGRTTLCVDAVRCRR